MNAHVIVATKGRPQAVWTLLDSLARQVMRPTTVTIVGVTKDDVEGIEEHPFSTLALIQVLVTNIAGSCVQRNRGLDNLLRNIGKSALSDDFFVVFFDDDFRPAPDWLENCRAAFDEQPHLAALTGHVLADGAHGIALTEADAEEYIRGDRQPNRHWSSGETQRELDSMYGCNMAVTSAVARSCRFDENLPLYGWQEDQDLTTRSRAFGRTVCLPGCRGVHLGLKSGRTSGLLFGYSQIANPLYLVGKGTMPLGKATRFIAKHLLANSTKGLTEQKLVDYRGRLRGNLIALTDLARRRCHPRRILDLA